MGAKEDKKRAEAMRASGCGTLWEYLEDDDDDLLFKLRMSLEWDEASYRRMVQALIDALEATEGAELVPRALAWMFIYPVPVTLTLMNRPEFLKVNAGERNPDEGREYFAQRQQLLRALSLWFTDGRNLVKDDRLSLSDWSPTLRTIPSGGL